MPENRQIKDIIEHVRQELLDERWDAEDRKILRSMIDAWLALSTLGRFSKWIIIALAGVAGAIASFNAVAAEVGRWFGK